MSSFALVGPACNGGGDGDDTGSGGAADDGSGGKGTGGKGSADGGNSSGGTAPSTGGSSSDGGSSSGGAASGGTSSGGVEASGGNSSGGTTGVGGLGGDASSGGAESGGSAGDMGYGGEGGAPPLPEECGGCLKIFVPLAAPETSTDVHYDFGTSAGLDLSDAVITFRLKVVSEGTSGYYQFFGTNGESLEYASYYSGWQAFSTASDFIDATFNLSALTDPVDFYGKDFYKSDVRWFGIQVTSGNAAAETLGDTIVYIDSITVSDNSFDDFEFATNTNGFVVNTYNSPIDGSTATWVE